MKSFITLIIILLACESRQEIKAQQSVLFETGPSYFSNNLPDNYTHLYDFIGFTFNTRILFAEKTNSAFSIEAPVSVRSHFAGEIMNRFGLHVPVTIRISHLFDLKDSDHDIGSLSALVGFAF